MLRKRPKASTAADTMYPLLFDRSEIDAFPLPSDVGRAEPWTSFEVARRELASGNRDDAIAIWQRIAVTDNAESRVVLQAWRFLRLSGARPPPEIARTVLGAVIEIPIDGQHDVVASYADGSARYLNHGGDAIIYQGGSASIDQLVKVHIELSQQMADRIGTWDEDAELPKVKSAQGRVLAMTIGGIRFGQGPTEVMEQDPIASDLLQLGRMMAVELIQRSSPQGGTGQ